MRNLRKQAAGLGTPCSVMGVHGYLLFKETYITSFDAFTLIQVETSVAKRWTNYMSKPLELKMMQEESIKFSQVIHMQPN